MSLYKASFVCIHGSEILFSKITAKFQFSCFSFFLSVFLLLLLLLCVCVLLLFFFVVVVVFLLLLFLFFNHIQSDQRGSCDKGTQLVFV